MELFFRKYGEGPPLIILHGLYGSSDNWVSIARQLADHFEVFLPDQRNHGNSPHSKEHNYLLLKEDLKEFMDWQNIEKASILGHSMGGKTAMFFAADYPERINHLMVADISPRGYENDDSSQIKSHAVIIKAMSDIDFYGIQSRDDIDIILSKSIADKRVRQFLLKNISRTDDNEFTWKLNLKTIQTEIKSIMQGLPLNQQEITGFPVFFLKGADSDYITETDFPLIYKIFPQAEIEIIPNSGHWLHAEQPEIFIDKIRNFLL